MASREVHLFTSVYIDAQGIAQETSDQTIVERNSQYSLLQVMNEILRLDSQSVRLRDKTTVDEPSGYSISQLLLPAVARRFGVAFYALYPYRLGIKPLFQQHRPDNSQNFRYAVVANPIHEAIRLQFDESDLIVTTNDTGKISMLASEGKLATYKFPVTDQAKTASTQIVPRSFFRLDDVNRAGVYVLLGTRLETVDGKHLGSIIVNDENLSVVGV